MIPSEVIVWTSISCLLFGESQQRTELVLRNQTLLQGLLQEGVHLPVISWSSRQDVHLIFMLNHDLEGSDDLHRLSVDLHRNDLVVHLRLEFYHPSLTHLERLVHAYLHLPHVQHIAQSDHLQQTIAVAVLLETILTSFPQFRDPSAPVVDVKDDEVLHVSNANEFPVDFHVEEFGEVRTFGIGSEEVKSADL